MTEPTTEDIKTIAMIPDPTMDDIKSIVDFFKRDPFSMDLDAVPLLSMSPEELLRLINRVCTYIDSTLDLQLESKEMRGWLVFDFLNLCSIDFNDLNPSDVARGDKNTLYFILRKLSSLN